MMEPQNHFSVQLFGRYFATLSVLPYLLLTVVLFFIACFFLVMILVQDIQAVFEIVLMPFILGLALMSPFLLIFLFMIRWHGKRRLDLDNQGITMVLPNEKSVFIPWEYLLAVELRFSKPKLVQCTLISPALRFSFSNLEYNLDSRLPLKDVFVRGFEVVKLREFLYHLHRKAPNLTWRISESFKEKYQIYYPPYDLEKLK